MKQPLRHRLVLNVQWTNAIVYHKVEITLPMFCKSFYLNTWKEFLFMWWQDRTLQLCVSRTKPSVRFRPLWIRLRDYDNIPLVKFQDRRSMIANGRKRRKRQLRMSAPCISMILLFFLLNFKETRLIIVKIYYKKGKTEMATKTSHNTT